MKDTYNVNTTAKIKGKEYNVSILLRDFDKAEEYEKKRREHNSKVQAKSIKYELFALCLFVGAFISMINIDNYGFLKDAFLILSMLSVLFGLEIYKAVKLCFKYVAKKSSFVVFKNCKVVKRLESFCLELQGSETYCNIYCKYKFR